MIRLVVRMYVRHPLSLRNVEDRRRRMHTLQKFAAVHASFHNHFALEPHLTGRDQFKANRSAALAEWKALAA